MIKIAIAAFVLLFPCDLLGQENFARGYAIMREGQLRAFINQDDWQTADKISLSKIDPEKPREEPQLDPRTLEQGQCGILEYFRFKVMQVIDGKNVILTMENPDIPPFWIADYDTSHLVDGERVRVVGMVDVGETKKYTTVHGSETTIRVIRLSKREIPKQKPKTFHRTFYKIDGEVWITGFFKSVEKGIVTIEDEAGKEHQHHISKLAKDDRKAIADYVKINAQKIEAEKRKEASENNRGGKLGGKSGKGN